MQTMDNSKVIEAALALRAGISEDRLVKEMGEQVVEAGYKERNISLKDVMTEAVRASGKTVSRGFTNDTIKAAFSTNVPGILGNVLNKRLQESFKKYEPVAFKLASIADINDFKESEIYSIADSGDLTLVGSNSKLADSSLIEGKGTNKLETYGKIIQLTRQQIINDDLGAFLKTADILGNRCARTIDKLFFSKLMANPNFTDSKALFSADHGNLLEGTATALSIEAVKNAIAVFLKQTDIAGDSIGEMPTHLVTSPELFMLAREICESQYVVTGNTKVTAQLNAVAGIMEPVVSPYLSNASITGNSATAWYMFSNNVPALEIGFLNGNRTPTIEQAECDFEYLGLRYRCFYDLGVGVADYRGVLKATGVAEVTESSSSSN